MAQKALEKLLGRTLGSTSIDKKNAKKQRRRQNRLVKRTKSRTTSAKPEVPKPKSEKSAEELEIENIRQDIAGKLAERVVWTKRARMEHAFEGLTPGLAPVGYDPDESDEEPY